jgi:hypothetical protein
VNIQSAHSPAYINAESTFISLVVKFEEFPTEIPFGASPNDVEPHGVTLFNNAVAGMYGDIAAYVPPPPPPAPAPQPTTSGLTSV